MKNVIFDNTIEIFCRIETLAFRHYYCKYNKLLREV